MTTEFQRNENGDVINPPVIPEFEQRLNAAQATGDQVQINAIQDEYHKAREDEIQRIESQQPETTDGAAADQNPNGELGNPQVPTPVADDGGTSGTNPAPTPEGNV